MKKGLPAVIILVAASILMGAMTLDHNRTLRDLAVAERQIAAQQQALDLMKVTAYCPCERCCGEYTDGITASGHVIQPGDKFVAAPKQIPFGTMLNIPGYGIVPVLDRGGAIKVNRLDVYFPSHQAAKNWGVKYLEVKIEETK